MWPCLPRRTSTHAANTLHHPLVCGRGFRVQNHPLVFQRFFFTFCFPGFPGVSQVFLPWFRISVVGAWRRGDLLWHWRVEACLRVVVAVELTD